ncbi:hypothetical protein [Massilia sp. 9I]|uniref:hypothetical protein n=1 Tax=Massilia sp. 9I TaxID=2653152 RepID=UPI0012F469BE|nr:hypothetical protein [Massilia sp. 9I]VXC71260.1 hypothetical protein MASSI9I_90419 [Massilia sp. 9I]
MKSLLTTLAIIIAILSLPACTSIAAYPVIEQSIYRPLPLAVAVKQRFYVRERERPLLPTIESASNAIVRFLLDVSHPFKGAVADVRPVLEESRPLLRLPPARSMGPGRYVGMLVYCWESEGSDRLRFLVEWADVTRARYTDSYVFVRRGSSWYFEKHGAIEPWHWTQTQLWFQRECPK